MGDHRAHIKINLTMYGQTRSTDMSINWSPPIRGGCDERVSAWFSETAEELYQTVYSRQIAETARAREEADERTLYEHLKKKYEK